jgi:hypothetical protein
MVPTLFNNIPTSKTPLGLKATLSNNPLFKKKQKQLKAYILQHTMDKKTSPD